jgi:hypothetical protein
MNIEILAYIEDNTRSWAATSAASSVATPPEERGVTGEYSSTQPELPSQI